MLTESEALFNPENQAALSFQENKEGKDVYIGERGTIGSTVISPRHAPFSPTPYPLYDWLPEFSPYKLGFDKRSGKGLNAVIPEHWEMSFQGVGRRFERWLRRYCAGLLEKNDPSSNHFVVPLTGFAGQRASRRQALPVKLKHTLDSRVLGGVHSIFLEKASGSALE